MSTLNLGDTNIFTDLGKVVSGTLLTNNVVANTQVNMYSLDLTKGTWLCVFMYRTDNQGSGITYGSISGLNTGATGSAGFTVVDYVVVTSATQTVYAKVQGSTSYTWSSGGRKCYAIKIA